MSRDLKIIHIGLGPIGIGIAKMVLAKEGLKVVGACDPGLEKAGIPGYLIDGPEDLRQEWFAGKQSIGLTAGASAPEVLVQRVVAKIREWGGQVPVEAEGQVEHVMFSLPRELRPAS